ncbi:uncharacterized protein LOC111071746 [Drosophila obscura]|uniref:uncharacterized protein LOC111071746 n=1 Tax=Drosophila obscura TaxID=7282 RepID=UPI001BB246DB|nr:uncharacterized protein LOC111071746 [Drosophila obscura]
MSKSFLILALLIVCESSLTHQLKLEFPFIERGIGCGRINGTVPAPHLGSEMWIITRWMANQKMKPFKCFQDDFPPDIPVATHESVFLGTDNITFAVHLICLDETSSEQEDDKHYYLVQTYSTKKHPVQSTMNKIRKIHEAHGLRIKWLRGCK